MGLQNQKTCVKALKPTGSGLGSAEQRSKKWSQPCALNIHDDQLVLTSKIDHLIPFEPNGTSLALLVIIIVNLFDVKTETKSTAVTNNEST